MNLKYLIELVVTSALVMTGTSCSPHSMYRIGGTVTGLTGSRFVLHSSRREDLSITADGAFAFSIAAPNGAAYEVTASHGSSFIRSPWEAACALFPELAAPTRFKLADAITLGTGTIAKVYRSAQE